MTTPHVTRSLAAVLVAVAAAATLSCGPDAPAQPKAAAAKAPARGARKIPVTVVQVAPRALVYSISATGQLAPNETVRIPARVQGVIEDVVFDPGTRVTRGMLLARIDAERFRLAVAREQARVEQAESALALADQQLARRKALSAEDAAIVSAEDVAGFQARADQAKGALAVAVAARDLARKDLQDADVRAETAGIIEERLVATGEHVEEGQTLATIVDVSRLRLIFRISESEAARLGSSPVVRFTVRSAAGRTFETRLAHVASAADPSTRQVECLAWVDDPPPELKPGYFAEVTIEFGGNPDALVVPSTAVLPTERGLLAYVLDGSVAHERKVTLGLQSPTGDVEILQGLSAGDTVVVRGAAALREGAEVEITGSPTGPAAQVQP